MKRVLAGLFVLFCALHAREAAAQTDTLGFSAPAPRWVGQFTTLSANAVLGGLTGGIVQELRGGSFRDGFTRGALGGAIVYSGKRLAVERFFGAGFVGREVAAVGSSVVRNASDGTGTLDRLVLPLAFTKVYWDRTQSNVRVKLDVVAAGYVAYGVVEDELRFDSHESLSAGTFVFRTNNKVIGIPHYETHAAGVQAEGVVFRSDVPGWGRSFLQRAVAHERVHVLQDDQIYITLTSRFDDWLFAKSRPTQAAARFIDVNFSTEMLRQIARLIPHHADRPWEMEAIYLTR